MADGDNTQASKVTNPHATSHSRLHCLSSLTCIATQFQPVKVVIVGAGYVGSTTAYTLLMNRAAAEIVLIDVDKDKTEGEVMDLVHAAPFLHQTRIWAGDYEDCKGASVIILTAGANQKPGQSRMELAQSNWGIFKEIVPKVAQHASPDALLLVSANPVDVMTYAAVKFSGFPAHRVIGSGTSLDSARFAGELGKHLNIDPRSLHAVVIGEHGESELPVWSLATVSGMRVEDYCRQTGTPWDEETKKQCFANVKDAAAAIIEKKGVTGYGIASALLRIVECVRRDENTLMPVSCVGSYAGVDDVALSVPRKLNRYGCMEYVPMMLSKEEEGSLRASAEKVKETIQSLEKS